MAMGRRKLDTQQQLFLAPRRKSPGHPFFKALNALLAEAGFDPWIERRCLPYNEQEETRGQPSIPPGVYFRMLFVGYFEGIDSQRGIAWRCADSRSLERYLGLDPDEETPDHSSMTPYGKNIQTVKKTLPRNPFESSGDLETQPDQPTDSEADQAISANCRPRLRDSCSARRFIVVPDHEAINKSQKSPDSRCAMIVAQQATEPFPAFDLPGHGSDFRSRIDQLIVETLMVPLPVKMGGILVERSSQRSFTEKDHSIQRFGFQPP